MRLYSSVTEIYVVRDMARFLRACHICPKIHSYVKMPSRSTKVVSFYVCKTLFFLESKLCKNVFKLNKYNTELQKI